MALGIVLVRCGIVRSRDSKVLSMISLYLVMPCVIISSFQVKYQPEILNGLLLALATAVLLHLVLIVLLPIADTMGYNLVYFGVVVVLNLMIGQVTPPFGVCLFVISDVNKIKLERIYKSILPFLVPLLITLAVTCIFPQVVTFLPDMLLGATAA